MLNTIDAVPQTRNPADSHESVSSLPPVILLGGGANALSVARSLGARGISVFAVNEPNALVKHSRYCRPLSVPSRDDLEQSWADFLLGPNTEHLRGAVLLTCSDAGIRVLTRHRHALAQTYRLDLCDPDAQISMLDKLETYRAAQAAGVPTPRFWVAESSSDIAALRDSLVFPLLVKPRLSHIFEERFGRKFVVVDNMDELLRAFESVSQAGLETLLVELIPGPDDRLCSYFTYLDEEGRPQFHFTKRVIRRYPVGMGTGCYHVTDWNPEVADLALRLLSHVGLRGLGNVEFKRDDRDGQLKLIECNARFVASNSLVARSGFDLANFVYNRIVGLPQQPLESYARGVRLWDPVRDFQCFLALRRRGEMTFREWLASVMHPQSFPFFRWSDPLPAIVRVSKPLTSRLRPGGAPLKSKANGA